MCRNRIKDYFANRAFTILFLPLTFLMFILSCVSYGKHEKSIDRQAVVNRHKIITTATNPRSPAQVGNGEFAFGVDITGLQTFVPFNTMSHWGWHCDSLPAGLRIEDFKGKIIETHGRPVPYPIYNEEQPELSEWLAGNPHRMNLGRLSFSIKTKDGHLLTEEDLHNSRQELDLWKGIITSYFEIEGIPVRVMTSCNPDKDIIGVNVKSKLIEQGRLSVMIEFPYATAENSSSAGYVGIWDQPEMHRTTFSEAKRRVNFARKLDEDQYYASLAWDTECILKTSPDNPHRFELVPEGNTMQFICAYSPEELPDTLPASQMCFEASKSRWPEYWNSGAFTDLSGSTDPRWKELERRIVLSQYLMKVNEAGSLPPQESGLVNNGWFGRFHFEMIWWHGVHYALWGKWPLFEKSLHVYNDFLPIARQQAAIQGYKGARWPKCTAWNGREWPHPIHAMLIWQQPHPIYFAELDYRLHPTAETLAKWKEVVFETAEFMTDFAYYQESNDRYILGPPVYIVSENTEPENTFNPAFELGYWRFGLRVAQEWRKRLGLETDNKWNTVLKKLSPLPQQDGLYVTHENIDSIWTKFAFEHPALIGTYGMLPGDGVDQEIFGRTLEKVHSAWDFEKVWGWDFPMLAMAAARSNQPGKAIDFLLTDSQNFQFDEHGLATGGPFPYFPSNGGLLAAIAMMSGGWDGAPDIPAPGFPKNGQWNIRYEGFNKMP